MRIVLGRFFLGLVFFRFIYIVPKMKEGDSMAICNVLKAIPSRKSMLTKMLNWYKYFASKY